MCDRVIYKDPFMIIYCPSRYKTQKMSDKLLMIIWEHQNIFLIGLLQVKCLKSFVMVWLLT